MAALALIGGWDGKTSLTSVKMLMPPSDGGTRWGWNELPPLPEPRQNAAACFVPVAAAAAAAGGEGDGVRFGDSCGGLLLAGGRCAGDHAGRRDALLLRSTLPLRPGGCLKPRSGQACSCATGMHRSPRASPAPAFVRGWNVGRIFKTTPGRATQATPVTRSCGRRYSPPCDPRAMAAPP